MCVHYVHSCLKSVPTDHLMSLAVLRQHAMKFPKARTVEPCQGMRGDKVEIAGQLALVSGCWLTSPQLFGGHPWGGSPWIQMFLVEISQSPSKHVGEPTPACQLLSHFRNPAKHGRRAPPYLIIFDGVYTCKRQGFLTPSWWTCHPGWDVAQPESGAWWNVLSIYWVSKTDGNWLLAVGPSCACLPGFLLKPCKAMG